MPNSSSVWELGAGLATRGKIRSDFAGRRERDLPDGWNREQTTYVAVTLRKLDDLDILENELKADSPWKNIKILRVRKHWQNGSKSTLVSKLGYKAKV